MNWKPIETAPKDGTIVWLRAPWGHDGLQFQDWTGSFAVHSDGSPPEWRMHSKDIGWCRQHPPTGTVSGDYLTLFSVFTGI